MVCPNRNKFCVSCGLFVPKNKVRTITKTFKDSYEKYFVINFPPNNWYVPEIVCDYCYRSLTGLGENTRSRCRMKYIYPVIWLLRSEHSIGSCYFCQTQPQTYRVKYKSRGKINYHICESVKPAVVRSTLNPCAPSEEVLQCEHDYEMESFCEENINENISEFQANQSELTIMPPHLITQDDFHDLVRDINISQRNSEILASRLQQWRLVSANFRVTSARKRANKLYFDECFHMDENTKITYAPNIPNLFEVIGHSYVPQEWRLFIDGSVKSLKGVLLHIGNKYPSVPIIYGTDIVENYSNMEIILKLINYDSHKWVICCDLKVVAILMGLKKGYSKHQCFLCLWEGRSREFHYTNHKWHSRHTYRIGQDSIENKPLVPASKIILPPLHIKLGLIRNFTRALDSEGPAMEYLKTFFPKLSNAKIIAGKI